jgi:hypothetical protein
MMPERQCVSCTRQVEWGCEAEPYVERDEQGRPKVGADGKPVVKWHKAARLPLNLNGEEVWACPRQDLIRHPREWNRLLMLYGLFKRGHLPEQGAALDQSNRILEMFRLLDAVNFECDEALDQERREKQQKLAEAQQSGGGRR